MFYAFMSVFTDAILTRLGVSPRALKIAYRHHYNAAALAHEVLDTWGWKFVAMTEKDAQTALQRFMEQAADEHEAEQAAEVVDSWVASMSGAR